MSVQGAFSDVVGGLQISATSRRQPDAPQGRTDAPIGGSEMLRADNGWKEHNTGGLAAPSEERRRSRRYSHRLPMTLSVFNQGNAFQAQMVNCGQDGICAETGHCPSPGTSIHLWVDTCRAAEVGKAVLQGLRTTALGEVKWCRAMGQSDPPRYRIGLRYYTHY
jgi:hypothetical protein